MKQSNELNLFSLAVSLLFFAISLLYIFSTKQIDFSFLNDRTAYAYCIDSEIVTNWHSVLFIKEHILLKQFCDFLGVPVQGKEVLQITYFSLLIFICIVLSLILYKLSSKNCIFFLSFVPFFIAIYAINSYVSLTLDFYYIALEIAVIALTYLLYKTKTKLYKTGVLLLLVILIIHMGSYRKNSIFSISVIVFYLLPFVFPISKKISSTLRILISSLVALAASFAGNSLLETATSSVNDYPLIPFLLSDISAVSTLTNEPLPQDFPVIYWRGIIPPTICNKVGVAGSKCELCNTVIQTQMKHPHYVTERIKFYESIKSKHIEIFYQHPKDFIMGRIIIITQFYTGGWIPTPLKQFVEHCYPHLALLNSNWTDESHHQQPIVLRFAPRLMGILGCILGACLSFYRKQHQKSPVVRVAQMGFLMGICYALSFVFAPPAVEHRYLLPVLVIFLTVFPCFLSTLWPKQSIENEEKQ